MSYSFVRQICSYILNYRGEWYFPILNQCSISIPPLTIFSSVSISDFEQINVSWVFSQLTLTPVHFLMSIVSKKCFWLNLWIVLQTVYGIELFAAGIYLFKVNNRNTKARCLICSKLTIKTPMASFWCLYC